MKKLIDETSKQMSRVTPKNVHFAGQKSSINVKNHAKGLKWFKGGPKKSANQKFESLKSAQKESSSRRRPSEIAARIVEIDIEGSAERLGVTEQLPILEKGANLDNFLVKISTENSSTRIPNSSSINIQGKKAKAKSKRNGKVVQTSVAGWKNLHKSEFPSNAQFAEGRLNHPIPEPKFQVLEEVHELDYYDRPNAYIRYMEATQEELSDEIEYDLEEEDVQWLDLANESRKAVGLTSVKRKDMELLLDRLEKESYFQMQSTGMDHGPPIDEDAVCCICMDGECQNSNAILFCDMCNLAVHQDCYGVPYIPEGQWLCRKCLHSPSRAVECVLCPNKGGAMKGTDDGRWAHVACAIWIPEVCFANTVFLEPIESISNIPAARWRLTCFICKQKGIGACIQCYKTSCYTAFHVTCAQQANLVMKIETVRELHMPSVIIKKIAYCNSHAPPDLLLEKLKEGNDLSSQRMKMRQTRKLLAEKRDAIPVVLTPTIPRNRLVNISNRVSFSGKTAFMNVLMSYWKLKRQFRNGVPLLRRLQMASFLYLSPHSRQQDFQHKNRTNGGIDRRRDWVRLRQDLERARLLCEMIRKREKHKRELLYARVAEAELSFCPMRIFFLNIIDEVISHDHKEVFLYPVDPEEVPDYLTLIKKPMDLTTMRANVNNMKYTSLKELEADFSLIIENCLKYNEKDDFYYKTGLRIKTVGGAIFKKAKKVFEAVGYNPHTGLHLSMFPVKCKHPKPDLLKSTLEPEVICKCSISNNNNNQQHCNNNCKNVKNTGNSEISSSFTTYRSGQGDGVTSDSEDDKARTEECEESESESEISSSESHSSSDEGSKNVLMQFDSDDTSNSSESEEEVDSVLCRRRDLRTKAADKLDNVPTGMSTRRNTLTIGNNLTNHARETEIDESYSDESSSTTSSPISSNSSLSSLTSDKVSTSRKRNF